MLAVCFMHSEREEIKSASAGDIVAIVGLKDTTTGDTLCHDSQVILTYGIPRACNRVAVEPKTKADQEKMGIALARLAAEDPSFRVRLTMKQLRRLSQVWVNFTSTFSLIV